MPKAITFHVTHGDFSVTLVHSEKHTLQDLAETILKAVKFDCDHCYGFYNNLKNPYRSTEEYTLFADIGEDAKEGDTGVCSTDLIHVFQPKKKLLFHFDYGDDWHFIVTCLKIEETKSNFRKPKILDPKGTPPVQYPDYDEND